jgi:ABC-type Fe3+-hydroxamate transport system substrate-binding protein
MFPAVGQFAFAGRPFVWRMRHDSRWPLPGRGRFLFCVTCCCPGFAVGRDKRVVTDLVGRFVVLDASDVKAVLTTGGSTETDLFILGPHTMG